ncbi:MAG: DUF1549 and DUF1553 domain-containing protein [Verrucomicrobiota bacterium]
MRSAAACRAGAFLVLWFSGAVNLISAEAGSGESQPWWSLKPLVRPAVPGTEEEAGAGRKNGNPIDAFILDRLAAEGMAPSPEAERRVLIRRLSYDLTGLPPSGEKLAAFVADEDPGAYEKLVDRMLASPRYGEHWARHWLDVAGYADTHGNDHDFIRPNAWPWRDWVIGAFNNDKPYARFVREQVAGDALFPGDPQATVALGFLAAGPWDHTLMVTVREDTVDHRMAQNLDRDAMVTAVMGTFQSLTVQCARCHNHKFDPVSQREYYALQAVFAGVDRADRPFDDDPALHAKRQRLRAEKHALEHPDEHFLTSLESAEISGKVAYWEAERARREKAWRPLEALGAVSTGGSSLTKQADASWFVSGVRPAKDSYVLTIRPPAGKLSALRLEALPDDRLPQRGPGRWDNGNCHLSEFQAFAGVSGAAESGKALVFSRASADHNESPASSAAQAIDGNEGTAWGVHPRYGEAHHAIFELKEPVVLAENTLLTVVLEFRAGAPGHGLGRFRVSATDEAPSASTAALPAALEGVLRVPTGERTPDQRRTLALAVLKAENQAALDTLPAPRMVYAVTRDFPPDGPNFNPPAQPRPIHLLARGELSRPGEPVGPAAPGCVPGLSTDLAIADPDDESARRAALALWLTDDRNVLTWRSIVNRVWHWHFGRGLCDTPNDFGKMGGVPSHPELLDWLAVWFRDEAKGSLKALHRLIVTSHTWRQSSLTRQGAETDADNRLLWRGNRERLSAEEVRDTLLMLGGQLDPAMGGPAAVQFIAKGDATFNPGGNPPFVDYANFDPDAPAARRRAVYRFLFRTVPDPLMDALDAPDGGSIAAVRGVSTTAVQAFALLNNSFVLRQCGHIAEKVTAAADTPEAQTGAVFQLLLQRSATDRERAAFAAYISRHGVANACQMLINGNEFLLPD